MSYLINVNTRGRITIPKQIRKALELKGGEKLYFRFGKNKSVIISFDKDFDKIGVLRKEPKQLLK